jgi:hypothetical protein
MADSDTDHVLVVNMIPASLSGETDLAFYHQIAVNPDNPSQIASTAYPLAGVAGLSYSEDGGETWRLLDGALGTPVMKGVGEIQNSIGFATRGGRLYALRTDQTGPDALSCSVLRTGDFGGAGPMEVLHTTNGTLGQFVDAVTATTGEAAGTDRVYTCMAPDGGMLTIGILEDAAGPAPRAKTVATLRPGIRATVAVHPDGTVYVLQYASTGIDSLDLVLFRDDSAGLGGAPFASLVDPEDHVAGVRVVRNISLHPDAPPSDPYDLRSGSALSLAMHPGKSGTVYVCWNDNPDGTPRLRVRKSTDGGQTWSEDLRTIDDATNGALAVDTSGRLGVFYQQLAGTHREGAPAGQPRHTWRCALEVTGDDFVTTDAYVLSNAPVTNTYQDDQPLLVGNLVTLTAVGTTFYGCFTASNYPDPAFFPSGVKYQRAVDWTNKLLLDDNGHPVAESYDPFFFRVAAGKAFDAKAEIRTLSRRLEKLEEEVAQLRALAEQGPKR